MKHCVPLPGNAICFVWDQWGDPDSLPRGDDGLMSHHQTIRNCHRGNASHRSIRLRLNLTFSRAKYLHPLCLKRTLRNFTTLLCIRQIAVKQQQMLIWFLLGLMMASVGWNPYSLMVFAPLGNLIKNISTHKSANTRTPLTHWCARYLQSASI